MLGIIDSGVKIVTNGLVLWFDPSQKRCYSGSGTTLTDLSGDANTGTLTNGPTFTTTYGGGIVNDGFNDYISVQDSSSFSFTNAFTISIWVTGSGLNEYDCTFGKASDINWTDGWGMYYETQYMQFWVNDYAAYRVGYNIGSNSFGITNFVGTYDGSNLKMYRNNVLSETLAFSTNVENTVASLSIMSGNGQDYSLTGNMYAVYVYDRGLSATEVGQNYNAVKSRFGL